jgi:hypothetical protein
VRALGARRLGGDEGKRGGPSVYADPAGHPFCLVPKPSWAPSISSGA